MGGSQKGTGIESGRHILSIFKLLNLVPDVPMVGVENVDEFWTNSAFDVAKKEFCRKVRHAGYTVEYQSLNSSKVGSVQGARNRMGILLIKSDYASQRPHWITPVNTCRTTRLVRSILSASEQTSHSLHTPHKYSTSPPTRHKSSYRGPQQIGILANAPYKQASYTNNRGFKVYDINGPAAVITATTDLEPVGATQLYMDTRFKSPLIRPLTVREAWEVMGRPARLDTSEKHRNQKLQASGMS